MFIADNQYKILVIWQNAVNDGYRCIKLFGTDTANTVYVYQTGNPDEKYVKKVELDGTINLTEFMYKFKRLFNSWTDVKTTTLTKKAKGYRLRIDDALTPYGQTKAIRDVLEAWKKEYCTEIKPGPVLNTTPGTINQVKIDKKEKEKMNDFSLSNIKDAIINKVTTLDKKTVTIIGIIILLLLIATRYQDIKDILIGIKDKVKRSKNFKAMVEDGTNAVNSLKKIVGIKDKGNNND